VLCPFTAVGFASDSTALLSEPVEIATIHARGPRTNAYAPPAYDPPAARAATSANNLEVGFGFHV
jgi:hypothetical protein